MTTFSETLDFLMSVCIVGAILSGMVAGVLTQRLPDPKTMNYNRTGGGHAGTHRAFQFPRHHSLYDSLQDPPQGLECKLMNWDPANITTVGMAWYVWLPTWLLVLPLVSLVLAFMGASVAPLTHVTYMMLGYRPEEAGIVKRIWVDGFVVPVCFLATVIVCLIVFACKLCVALDEEVFG